MEGRQEVVSMSASVKSTAGAAPGAGRPLTAYEKARDAYFDAVGAPVVQSQRLFIVALLTSAIAVASVVALVILLPLKSVEPWVIAVRSDGSISTGESAAVPLRTYSPDQAVLSRELFQFVSAILTVNGEYPKLIEEDMRKAFARTRRAAQGQFADHVKRTDPFGRMKTDRSVLRSVARNTITYRDAGYALVRVSVTERSASTTTPAVKRYLVTVTYELTPSTALAELNENPLGLYITSFDVQEEQS
jgi:type IV secretory pathway TrbF-like protein